MTLGTQITVLVGHKKGERGKVVEVTAIGLIYVTLDKYRGTDYEDDEFGLYTLEELERRV